MLKITKGNNSAKKVGGVTVLISASCLVMLYISTKFCEIISNGIKSYRADMISILKISKGNNSAKHVGGVTIFNLITLSGLALYFYKVL